MSDFEINLQKVKQILSGEASISDQLNGIQGEVNGICNNLGFKIASTQNIRGRLRKISDQIYAEGRKVKEMERVLKSASTLYETTEERICDSAEDGEISFVEQLQGKTAQFLEWDAAILGNTMIASGPAAGLVDFLLKSKVEIDALKVSLDDYFPDKLKDICDGKKWKEFKRKEYWDEDGTHHVIDGNDEKAKEKFDSEGLNDEITLYDVKAEVDESLWEKKTEVSGRYGDASYEAKLVNGNLYAEAYGRLYSVGADGEKHFTPGVGAQIGGAFTALSLEGQALLGNDDLGAYVEGSVALATAGANAGIDVGFLDKDGNFNPQAQISAEAEALLAEAAVGVGAKVLGTDVKGTVGVNVGIGAHADVGFKDGKLSLDVGASVGVGVSVDLEIDVGGTLDKAATAISDAVSGLWDAAGKALNW